MKITALEEYGLRCILQLARGEAAGSKTIPEIAESEGLSTAYVGKLLNLLRQSGLVRSVRGRSGGYALDRPTSEITVGEVLSALGTSAWEPDSCSRFTGARDLCVRSAGCSIRALWGTIDRMVTDLLGRVTLADLAQGQGARAGIQGPVLSRAGRPARTSRRSHDPKRTES